MDASTVRAIVDGLIDETRRNEIECYDDRVFGLSKVQGVEYPVGCGGFEEAVARLVEFDSTPDGLRVKGFDPDDWEDADEEENERAHLTEVLSCDGEIGEGDPVAWVGWEEGCVLVRESATSEQVCEAARSFLVNPDFVPDEDA